MTLVHIPSRHRADRTAGLQSLGLSLSLAIVDTEPRADADADSGVDGGCARCSLVSFLKSRRDLAGYQGLTHLLHALDRFGTASGSLPRERAGGPGKSVYRIASQHRGQGDRVLHVDVGDDDVQWPEIRPDDMVVLRPDGAGPGRLLAQLGRARRAGAQKILLGYVRHADAVDHFAPFVEHPELRDGWLNLLAQARHLGFGGLGFAMAYPPCATLQWSGNRALESLRARLDLQFRRLDNEASLMCPENVSGYSLLNDVRESLGAVPIATARYAIRTQDTLLVF